ncbi:VWA domain-containing protein [Thiorhodococcus minor]|uniref:VWA domain-containing protein n=1 Tax=Thiorhodococcus minor TaxID=57489 RepID=A0A6M0K7K8_9GAMM|nr:VWA domain-containing protein [Thiorhodococcus minor]
MYAGGPSKKLSGKTCRGEFIRPTAGPGANEFAPTNVSTMISRQPLKETAKSRALCSVLLVFALLCSAVSAGSVDVVLALDHSLSMHANDPGRIGIDAAELFVELLGEDDRLALMTFGVDAVTLMPLTPLSSTGAKAQASVLLRDIVMNGRMTNFEAALSAAYRGSARDTCNSLSLLRRSEDRQCSRVQSRWMFVHVKRVLTEAANMIARAWAKTRNQLRGYRQALIDYPRDHLSHVGNVV